MAVTIAVDEIELVACFNYLGVWLNECMSFNEYIQPIDFCKYMLYFWSDF